MRRVPIIQNDAGDKCLNIGGRLIGPGCPPYIVAELSANHNGSLDRALRTIEAVAGAGVDAVKLQTYTADTITIDCDLPDFVLQYGPWEGRSLYSLYQEAGTPWEWHERLFAEGRRLGVTVFSTPFDETAVALLEKLGTPMYKIASFEIVDHALIASVAATGKPIVMSTGMASYEEIGDAVSVARGAGSTEIILLHCISEYPAPASGMNLAAIGALRRRFGCPVGLSDHSLDPRVAVAAVAVGACMIEKHVTLGRSDGGPDSGFSLEPGEVAELVASSRLAYAAMGDGSERRSRGEVEMSASRRSLYVVENIPAGAALTAANVRSIRPGFGMRPSNLEAVLGRRATRDLPRGTALTWDCLM